MFTRKLQRERRLPAAKGQRRSNGVHQSFTGPEEPRVKPGGATDVKLVPTPDVSATELMEQRQRTSLVPERFCVHGEAVILDLRSSPSSRRG